MQTAMRALAEPRRVEILRLVRRAPVPTRAIAEKFGVTRAAIRPHPRVLEEAGLVTVRRQGTRRLYRARPEALAELRAFLEGLWEDRLDNLKMAAEAEERKGSDASD